MKMYPKRNVVHLFCKIRPLEWWTINSGVEWVYSHWERGTIATEKEGLMLYRKGHMYEGNCADHEMVCWRVEWDRGRTSIFLLVTFLSPSHFSTLWILVFLFFTLFCHSWWRRGWHDPCTYTPLCSIDHDNYICKLLLYNYDHLIRPLQHNLGSCIFVYWRAKICTSRLST